MVSFHWQDLLCKIKHDDANSEAFTRSAQLDTYSLGHEERNCARHEFISIK